MGGIPGVWTDRDRPAIGVNGCIDEIEHRPASAQVILDELKERNAKPHAVQACHKCASQNSQRSHAMVCIELTACLVDDRAEFQLTYTTQVVDHQHNRIGPRDVNICTFWVVQIKKLG